MRITYYPDTDSLAIDLKDSYRGPGYGVDLAEGVSAHYSQDGELVSIEMESGASRLADLPNLEAEGLEVAATKAREQAARR